MASGERGGSGFDLGQASSSAGKSEHPWRRLVRQEPVKDLHWTRYWVAGWVRRHLLQAKRVVGELRRGQTRDWAPRFGLRRLAGALVAVSIAALVGVPLVSVSQAAAAAAFGVDNAMSVNATGAATISGFSTTQAGDLLVAFVSADGPSGGHQSATVSGGSLTWSLVRRTNAQPGTAEVWQAVASNAVSAATFKSTLGTGGYSQSFTIVAFSGSGGTGANSGSSGTSTTASVSLTTTSAGSLVYAVGHDWSNASPRTLGNGQTMVHEWSNAATGDDYWVQRLTNPVATPGSVTVNSSVATSDIWAQTDVEIVPAAPPDTQPPSAPGTLTASGGPGTASLSWGAATDNVGVAGYTVYRSVTSGFTPGPANQAEQTSATSFTDSGLAGGTYYYVVTAFDAAGNVGQPSNEASATVTDLPPGDNTTYLRSNVRSGFDATETAITPASAGSLVPAWSAPSQGNSLVSSQVVTSAGVAFWGDQEGYEHATNVATGAQLWLSPQLGVLLQSQVPTCPGYAPIGVNGAATIGQIGARKVVYVADGLANEYALDASTGTIVWKTNLGAVPQQIFGSNALYNSSVYVGVSSDGDCPSLTQGKLVKLDAATGAVQATFDVVPNGCIGGGIWSAPTIDAADNAVYVTSGNGSDTPCSAGEPYAQAVIKLRADTLAYVSSWQQPDPPTTDHDFGTTPTLFQATINGVNRLLVGAVNKNGVFYTLDRTNLAAGPVWTHQVSDPGSQPDLGQGSIGPASYDGTNLYIGGGSLGSCGSELASLDPATGVPHWQDCLDGPIPGGVVTAPGLVVAGVGQYLEVFASATGSTLFHWSDGNSAFYEAAPTISNGWLLAAKYTSGVLHALAPPGITGPTVIAASPAPSSVGVGVSTSITAKFNEAINPATVSTTVTSGSGTSVAGSWAYDPTSFTVTFTPTAPLSPGTTYNVVVSGATDSANLVMQPFSWTFTTAPAQGACPCFVQAASSHHGAATSLGVTPSSPLTSGNRLVVEVGVWSSGNATTATVSDSAGDPFTELTHFVASDHTEMSVWTAPISKGGGTSPTITAKPTAKADVGLAVAEYSGLATAADASVVDQTAQASGTTGASSAAVTSGATGATTAAGNLAIGFYADSGFGDALQGGSGFTPRVNVSNTSDMELVVEDQIVGLGATPASTFSTGSATTWLAATVVFKHV